MTDRLNFFQQKSADITRINNCSLCFSSTLFGGKSIGSLPTADENAYDVVPEYINETTIPSDNNYSSIYPFHSHSRAHSQNAPKRQPHNYFNGTNSSQFTNSSNSSAGSTTSPHSSTSSGLKVNNKMEREIIIVFCCRNQYREVSKTFKTTHPTTVHILLQARQTPE